jgi:hypothetical protein
MTMKVAADCTPDELYQRGLHALDQAEAQRTDHRVADSFSHLAMAYFQAVTAGVAILMGEAQDDQ